MIITVGDLKRELDNYPDTMEVKILDRYDTALIPIVEVRKSTIKENNVPLCVISNKER